MWGTRGSGGQAAPGSSAGTWGCTGHLRTQFPPTEKVEGVQLTHQFSSVQSLSRVRLFSTPWTAAHQVSLSITNSWSLLKLMPIELVMPSISPSVAPFSSCPQSFPASGAFPVSEVFASRGQSIRASASTSVQFSSVAQSSRNLCDPMNRSTPGLPVYHQLPEFTQTHVHRVGDAIQPFHPLWSPSPPAPNPSQH